MIAYHGTPVVEGARMPPSSSLAGMLWCRFHAKTTSALSPRYASHSFSTMVRSRSGPRAERWTCLVTQNGSRSGTATRVSSGRLPRT